MGECTIQQGTNVHISSIDVVTNMIHLKTISTVHISAHSIVTILTK